MKKISRRSFLMATGVIAASAALSACGGSSASTSSAGSTAASTAASGSAAQGGGDLVIYSPNSEGLLNATIPLFEEKYGVNVELIQAGTGELVKRIQSEKNDPYADVLFGGSWSLMYTNEDLWEPYVSANDANVIDAYKNKCGFITGNVLDGSVLIVNTDLLGDIKIEGYEDLLNPALKGKIATADPANSSSAFAHLTNMLLAMGGYEDDKAWQYVHDLFENVDGKICESSSGVYKGVADGEYVVGLSYEDPCAQLVLDGAPVKIVLHEGGYCLPSCFRHHHQGRKEHGQCQAVHRLHPERGSTEHLGQHPDQPSCYEGRCHQRCHDPDGRHQCHRRGHSLRQRPQVGAGGQVH